MTIVCQTASSVELCLWNQALVVSHKHSMRNSRREIVIERLKKGEEFRRIVESFT